MPLKKWLAFKRYILHYITHYIIVFMGKLMSGRIRARHILCLMLAMFGVETTHAAEVIVAVASNFTNPAKDIAMGFEQQTGHKAKLVFGSSGRIFAQISHGAPFDIFLSADSMKPAALVAQGMTLPHSRFTYAIGALALWSPKTDYVKAGGDVLKDSEFKRLAIANPKLAPYGIAAREVLQSLALYKTLSPKLVRGENIAQTYQFVATGNAELGFIARSQLPKGKTGSVWIIPDSLHKPIRQDAVILKSAENNQAALAFANFLRSEWAKELIKRHGYKLPTGDE